MYTAGASAILHKGSGLDRLLLVLRTVLAKGTCIPPLLSTATNRSAEEKSEVCALSPRELEVIRLFAGGGGRGAVAEISRCLQRSPKTISAQKVKAIRKLQVRNDQALIEYCVQASLVP